MELPLQPGADAPKGGIQRSQQGHAHIEGHGVGKMKWVDKAQGQAHQKADKLYHLPHPLFLAQLVGRTGILMLDGAPVLGDGQFFAGIDLDFEWAENAKEYEDYSLAILKMREVLGDKYIFSVSLHPVCYKISKEAIAAVDFISLQCYGPSPMRFPIEKYCSDIQMVLDYGIPKEKLVAGVPFYGVTKDNSKKTEAYFSFVQEGLITSPAQNEVTYKGDVYVFDGQDNIRIKTRYAKEQGLKGMMSWDLATDLPLSDSRSLLKAMIEELKP